MRIPTEIVLNSTPKYLTVSVAITFLLGFWLIFFFKFRGSKISSSFIKCTIERSLYLCLSKFFFIITAISVLNRNFKLKLFDANPENLILVNTSF